MRYLTSDRTVGGGYSITTTTSPEPTDWPAATLTSLTVPDLSAAMLFSIFIASSTHTVCPTSTSSPSDRRGRGAARPPAPLTPGATTGPACDSGTHTVTPKRRPLTSTSTSRRTFGSAASAASASGGNAGGPATADRSRRSSTHLVECSPATKSG